MGLGGDLSPPVAELPGGWSVRPVGPKPLKPKTHSAYLTHLPIQNSPHRGGAATVGPKDEQARRRYAHAKFLKYKLSKTKEKR